MLQELSVVEQRYLAVKGSLVSAAPDALSGRTTLASGLGGWTTWRSSALSKLCLDPVAFKP